MSIHDHVKTPRLCVSCADAYVRQQVREALEPYLVLATAAEEFWSECWDVSLPTVKKFSGALKAIAALRERRRDP